MEKSISPEQVLLAQRTFFAQGNTRDISFRIKALKQFYKAIRRHEADIHAALYADFRKSRFETWSTETGIVLEEIRLHCRKLKHWARTEKVSTPLIHFPSLSRIISEPYGQVLVMAPWNYPFMLALMPFIGAISAGNCVVLKTAHYSENTSRIIAKIIGESFLPEHAFALGGGREVNTRLLDSRFDYIFFTGSPSLGRIVMEKAAVNLTPVSLELGGKSPCIVTSRCHIKTSARRIVWGKFINAGQTCVAPDYLLVEESVRNELVREMTRTLKDFYGEDPRQSPDLPRIINESQWERVAGYLKDGDILCGGESDRDERYIAPTLLGHPSPDSAVMQEEIFGPVLPILTWKTVEEAAAFVVNRPKPLACYIFTEDRREEKFFLDKFSFGGGCINDTIVHLGNSALPFGGVGSSGMGRYHGKESFLTFSHRKSVLKKGTWLDIPLRYPPYSEKKLVLAKRFIR